LEFAVINARFAKPLDKHTLLRAVGAIAARRHRGKEAALGGRAPAARVLERQLGRLDSRHCHPPRACRRFVEHGERSELLPDLGLDANGICNTVRPRPSRATENGGKRPAALADNASLVKKSLQIAFAIASFYTRHQAICGREELMVASAFFATYHRGKV